MVHRAHCLFPRFFPNSIVVCFVRWDAQATIQRVNESLLARGFLTWFDLTNMKGSTMDAMRQAAFRHPFLLIYWVAKGMDDWLGSDAIEGADVMLYGVSLACKSRKCHHLRRHMCF